MKKITYLLSILLFVVSSAMAQTTIYTQNFEGADQVGYKLKNSSGTAVPFAIIGSDYILRATPASLPLGAPATGFSGNVIALEDHDGAGFSGTHAIEIDPINISGMAALWRNHRAASGATDVSPYRSASHRPQPGGAAARSPASAPHAGRCRGCAGRSGVFARWRVQRGGYHGRGLD